MAQYDITYGCGCKEVMPLYGPTDDRDRKIEWYGTIDCQDCKGKKAAKNNANGLTGSPKQIAWADSIIAKIKPKILKHIKEWEDGFAILIDFGETPQESEEIINKLKGDFAKITAILDHKEAEWWIENQTPNLLLSIPCFLLQAMKYQKEMKEKK